MNNIIKEEKPLENKHIFTNKEKEKLINFLYFSNSKKEIKVNFKIELTESSNVKEIENNLYIELAKSICKNSEDYNKLLKMVR